MKVPAKAKKSLTSRSKMSLRTKLILSFAVILFAPVIAISSLSYQTAKKEVADQMNNGAEQNVMLLNSAITQYATSEMSNADYLAGLITESTFTGGEATLQRKIFEPYYKAHSMVSSLEFIAESGYYRNVQGKEWAGDSDPREEEWYKTAIEDPSTVFISQPYTSVISGEFVIGISKAVADGSGVFRSEVKIEELTALAGAVQIGTGGYAQIIDTDHKSVFHPSLGAGEPVQGAGADAMFEGDGGTKTFSEDGETRVVQYVTNPITGWKIGGVMQTREFAQEAQPILKQTIIIVIGAILIAAAFISYILLGLFKSLRHMVQAADQISNGELAARIPLEGNDELGRLGASFNRMADSIHRSMSQIQMTAGSLAASSQQLSASADQAARATEHIADSAQSIHNGAEMQKTMLGDNYAQISDISGKMEEIDTFVSELNALSGNAGEKSVTGSENVQAVVEQMEVIHQNADRQSVIISELHEHSQQIEQIIKVIGDIAVRTNILALNAGIEAARAGEAGKGFAVVSSEIRKLAEQTGKSSDMIQELIGEISSRTTDAVSSMSQTVQEISKGIDIVKQTDRNFKDIQEAVGPLADMSARLLNITMEISKQAEAMTDSVGNVIRISGDNTEETQSVSASVEEQLASMEQISAAASFLSKTADELSAIVESFKL